MFFALFKKDKRTKKTDVTALVRLGVNAVGQSADLYSIKRFQKPCHLAMAEVVFFADPDGFFRTEGIGKFADEIAYRIRIFQRSGGRGRHGRKQQAAVFITAKDNPQRTFEILIRAIDV